MRTMVIECDPEYGMRLHPTDYYEEEFLLDCEREGSYGHRRRQVPDDLAMRYADVYAQWQAVQNELHAIYVGGAVQT